MPHQPRRNFWTGGDDHTVRQRRRSDWLRQRYRLRPGIERLDPKFEPRPSRRRENPHRHSLGELLARARPARPLRRHESQRRRPRRRRRSFALLHRAKKHLHRKMIPHFAQVIAITALTVVSAETQNIPKGFVVLKCTLSTDGRFGVTVPVLDQHRDSENPKNSVVELKTGRTIAAIKTRWTGWNRMGHGGVLPCRWSPD